MASETPAKAKKSSRQYTSRELKLLWGGGRVCAFPDCHNRLVQPATAEDDAQAVGIICHIVASSDDGPRGDRNFSEKQRDDVANLILLCPTCHAIVDKQPNTYTADDLRGWKALQESAEAATRANEIAQVTPDELAAVTVGLLATPTGASPDLRPPTPPPAKMRHNELGHITNDLFKQGQLRSHDVARFVADESALDPEFGDRLVAGFRRQYAVLQEQGLAGDDLYVSLANWAAGGLRAGVREQGAGLAVLSYLFALCDVFERAPST